MLINHHLPFHFAYAVNVLDLGTRRKVMSKSVNISNLKKLLFVSVVCCKE